MIPAALHILGVDARRTGLVYLPETAFVAALEVDVFEVEGVDVAREVAKKEGEGLVCWIRNQGKESGGRLVGGTSGGRKMGEQDVGARQCLVWEVW